MSKSKKFLIVCVILAGIGFFLIGLGTAFGGRITGIGFSPALGFQVSTSQHPYGMDFEEPAYEEKDTKLEVFSDIALYADYTNVSVVESDHYGIAYRTQEFRVPACEVTNGVLTVNQKSKPGSSSGTAHWFFSFNMNSYSYNIEEEYITIYFPKGAVLDSLNLKSDFGKTSVTVGGGKYGSLYLSNSYGDMKLKDIITGNLEIHMESGSLDMSHITAETLVVDNDYGSLDADHLAVSGRTEIGMESGSLDLRSCSFGSLTLDSDYGDFHDDSISAPKVSLSMESGDCRVRDFTVDTLDISSEYGSVDLYLTSPLADYGLDMGTEYGDILLDGEELKESGSHISTGHGSKQIKVRCEAGDISIEGSAL